MLELPFTHKPGRRERHLKRRHGNPLFARPPHEVEPEELLAAQKADHEEMEDFRGAFASLVRRAASLEANAASEQVLALKEELERRYEQACGLPEDHLEEKEAIKRLIALIMRAVWRAAGEDPLAHRELEDEEQARVIHFALLEHPLVADILHPESPILPDELGPAILCSTEQEASAASQLFDAEQLALIVEQGGEILGRLEADGIDVGQARQRLDTLEAQRREAERTRTVN
jgi:hypothetical protein